MKRKEINMNAITVHYRDSFCKQNKGVMASLGNDIMVEVLTTHKSSRINELRAGHGFWEQRVVTHHWDVRCRDHPT